MDSTPAFDVASALVKALMSVDNWAPEKSCHLGGGG